MRKINYLLGLAAIGLLCSAVESREAHPARAAKIAQGAAFGDAYSGFMRLEIIRVEKLYGMSGNYRELDYGCKFRCALHVELGMRSARALQFKIKTIRKQRCPFACQIGRAHV